MSEPRNDDDGLRIEVTEQSKTWVKSPATVISNTVIRNPAGEELVTVQVHLSDEDGAIVVNVESTEIGDQHPLRVHMPDHAS